MVVKKELCWNFITKWRKFILFLRVITEDYKNNIIVIIRLGYRSHLGLLSHSTIYNVPMFEIALINNGNYVYRRLQECHLRKCSGRSTSGIIQCSAEDPDTSVAEPGPDLSPAAPPPSQGRHTLQLQEAAADGPVLLVLGVSGTVQGVKGVSCLLETSVVTVLCQPRPPSCLAGVGLTPGRGRHEAGQEVLLREQRVSVVVRQTERLGLVVTDELLQILPLILIDFPLLLE